MPGCAGCRGVGATGRAGLALAIRGRRAGTTSHRRGVSFDDRRKLQCQSGVERRAGEIGRTGRRRIGVLGPMRDWPQSDAISAMAGPVARHSSGGDGGARRQCSRPPANRPDASGRSPEVQALRPDDVVLVKASFGGLAAWAIEWRGDCVEVIGETRVYRNST